MGTNNGNCSLFSATWLLDFGKGPRGIFVGFVSLSFESGIYVYRLVLP